MSDTNKEIIIVTGASSGIGLAIASHLLDIGYSVVGIARDFTKCRLKHADFRKCSIDLSLIEALPARLKSLASELSADKDRPIKALINNAGYGKMASLEQFSVNDITQLMNVNFLSHVLMTKAFMPIMKRQGHGDIVFIGPEAGLNGAQQGSIYCASKFALRGFAQSLRQECAKSSVRVSLINPGAVRSDFFNGLDFEPGESSDNAIEVADIAVAVAMIIQLRQGTVVDEINLSPQKKVWQKKV